MYFSFLRILLMVLVHHFVLPAPVRMPSASGPFAIRSIEYNGIEAESLDKKAVVDLLKNVPSDIADVLLLRQQLAKSSVKKYQAMQNAVCSDGRARGMFQFYGANRSGRWAGHITYRSKVVHFTLQSQHH